MLNNIKAFGKTDVGLMRTINQDSIFISVMWLEIFVGFKVMKKFTVIMKRYMNVIFMVE